MTDYLDSLARDGDTSRWEPGVSVTGTNSAGSAVMAVLNVILPVLPYDNTMADDPRRQGNI